MNVLEIKDMLVNDIVKLDFIKGLGQTGELNAPLIPGNSDIDMFVIGTAIPTQIDRQQIYSKYKNAYSECMMNVCSGGIWGYGDILIIDGIDVMFMYFTVDEMEQYIDEVLNGEHIDREGEFYPIGRLSTIENINILYEQNNEWTNMIDKLKKRPLDLFEKMYQNHICRVLNDEDLGRVILRKEVLYYQSVLENAIDHLLQALYSINSVYFPSRKRVEQYMNRFYYKPQKCYERLVKIVECSVVSERMEESVIELRKLTAEVKEIGDKIFNR